MRFDVFDAKADVMNPFAALLDELRDRRVVAGRLEQFEIRIADGKECGAHFLRGDILDVIDVQAERFVDLHRFDGADGCRLS